MKSLTGHRILITGASKGIGRACALHFASEGADLIVFARSAKLLKDLADEIEDSYAVSVFHASVDVGDEQSLKDSLRKACSENKLITGLLNNAGIMVDSTLQMVKSDQIQATYQTNVFGAMYCSKYVSKYLIRNKGGSIVNMTSIVGVEGNLGQTVYASSKAALIGFTTSLSKELAPLNIRVNAIAPGFIDTDMIKGMDQRFYERNLNSIGLGRLGKPHDVAKAAAFLLSDKSDYITGQILGVDGGMII